MGERAVVDRGKVSGDTGVLSDGKRRCAAGISLDERAVTLFLKFRSIPAQCVFSACWYNAGRIKLREQRGQHFVADQTTRPDSQNANLIDEVPVTVSPTTDQSETVSL